jgi:hypothetical protein
MAQSNNMIAIKSKSLIDHFLVVTINSSTELAEITHLYSSPAANKLYEDKVLLPFILPDVNHMIANVNNSYNAHNYCFVLTTATGHYYFGFCRRFNSLFNSKLNYPTVLCIITRFNLFSIFEPLLEMLEVRWHLNPSAAFIFLRSFLASPVPPAGQIMKVKINENNNNSDVLSNTALFERSDDLRSNSFSFQRLFECLSLDNILLIFSAILCEQKLIFVSNSVQTLSQSIHAAMQLLKPLQWQHIFIPILPPNLYSTTNAPMPFIVGIINENSLAQLIQSEASIEQCVLVYLDRDIVHLYSQAAENEEKFVFPLPEELIIKLKKHLKATGNTDENISSAFYAFFTTLFAHIDWNLFDAKGKYDVAAFLQLTQQVCPNSFAFLQSISQSQMIERFLNQFANMIKDNYKGDHSSNSKHSLAQRVDRFEAIRRCAVNRSEATRFIVNLNSSKAVAYEQVLAAITQINKANNNNEEKRLKLEKSIEKELLDLTSNDNSNFNSSATRELINQISAASNHPHCYPIILNIIRARLQDCHRSNWRQGYKGLLVLENMLKSGNERILLAIHSPQLQALLIELIENYTHEQGQIAESISSTAGRIKSTASNLFALRKLKPLYNQYSNDIQQYAYNKSNAEGKHLPIGSPLVDEKEINNFPNIQDCSSPTHNHANNPNFTLELTKYREKSLIQQTTPLLPEFVWLHGAICLSQEELVSPHLQSFYKPAVPYDIAYKPKNSIV